MLRKKSRISLLFVSSVVCYGCDNTRPVSACLDDGDPSCIDWSSGQDAHVSELPYNEYGDGLVAYTPNGNVIYGSEELALESQDKLSSQGFFMATAYVDSGVAMSSQSVPLHPQVVISQDGWLTVTQDVSYGKRVWGCVDGRITDYKHNTRITMRGLRQPLLDIHFVVFHNEFDEVCWGMYNSGTGSDGPGVCFCEDPNNPPPPQAREDAMIQQAWEIAPPDINYSALMTGMAIIIGTGMSVMILAT